VKQRHPQRGGLSHSARKKTLKVPWMDVWAFGCAEKMKIMGERMRNRVENKNRVKKERKRKILRPRSPG